MSNGGQVHISVLGPVTVADDDTQIDLGARLRRLLAALVAADGDVVSSDRLADIVWAGEPPAGADRTLRTYVSRLRKALPAGRDDLIVHRSPGYLIDLHDGELDAQLFDDEVERAMAHLRVGEIDEADGLLHRAVARWRGAAYAGFEHEDWARPQAVRLDERRLEAEEARVEVLLSTGRSDAAVAEARRLSEEHPLREQPRGLLMRALYGAGRRAEALRIGSEFRRYLAEETGLDPSAELGELEDRIVRDDPDLANTSRGLRSYELAEKIGEGAFATVHRATQPGLDREVAVKIIRAELADRPDFVRRFEVEARTIARIEHPNVVPLYDFWREPGAAYLIMRLLRGGTVEQAVLSRGAYSRDQVTRLLGDIGPALETAHRQGLVHRDVKPANLLLDDQSNTYLADFGIALPSATMDTMSVLSPAYAAPEVIRGEAAGPAADILSLGVTVFEVLTGRLPFESSTSRAELIDKQINEPLPPVRSTRTDLPAAVDEVLAKATAKAPGDRHASVSALVEDLRLALAGGTPRPSVDRRTATVVDAEAPNPYVGLHAFDEVDAERFRGRDALITELVEAVELNRLVTVVGPSGSGKSSVVRAGLLPAVRRGGITGSADWFITTMVPGNDPIDALETALLRVAVNPPASLREQLAEDGGLLRAVRRVLPDDRAELLLVIDQFEELFTQVEDDQERMRFLDELAAAITAPTSPLHVVSTIRADHYDAPLRHAAMAELVNTGTIAVRPMTPAELEQAIVGPAIAVGVEVERALVAELVAGVSQRPAGLPLLQFALTEAYDRRTAGVMMLDTHRNLGGLAGALAARAERILATGGQGDVDAARRIFGRLVTLGEGTEDTRRRTRRSELGDDERTAWILDAFASARLLTLDRDETTRAPTVEVAHEALLRDWPRLREWLAEDRADIRTVQGISAATAAWNITLGDPGELARGGRLESVVDLAGRRPDLLTDAEASWVTASIDAAEAEAEARAEAAERDKRQNGRLRVLLGVAATLLVVAIIGAMFALLSRNDAISARDEAETARGEAVIARDDAVAARNDADVERMVAQSAALLSSDADRAILLAIEANRRRDDVVTQTALHRVLADEPRRAAIHPAAFDGPVDSTLSSDGLVGLTWALETGEVVFFDTRSGEELHRHQTGARVFSANLTADGRRAVLSTEAATLQVVEVETGLVIEIERNDFSGPVAIADDGLKIASHTSGVVFVFDVLSGDLLLQERVNDTRAGFVNSLGLTQSQLVIGHVDFSAGPPVQAVDLVPLDGSEVTSIQLEGRELPTAATMRDGTVVMGFQDGDIVVVELSTGDQRDFNGHSSDVAAVAFDGATIVSGAGDGQVRRWTAAGEPMDRPIVVSGDIHVVVGTPDGETVVVLEDGRWHLFTAGDSSLVEERLPGTFSQVHPEANWYSQPGAGPDIQEWRALEDSALVATMDFSDVHPVQVGQPFYSADGRWTMTYDVGGDPRIAISELSSDVRVVLDSTELYVALAGNAPEFGGFVGSVRPIDGQRLFAVTETSDGRAVAAIVEPSSLEVVAGPLEVPNAGSTLVLSDGRVVIGNPSGQLVVLSAALDVVDVIEGGAGLAPWHEDATTGSVVVTGIDGQVAILESDLTLRFLDDVVGSAYSAAFSPDGRRLAIATFTDGVQLVDVASGELIGVGVGESVGGEPGRGVRWTEDGSSVWVAPTGGPVRIAADPDRWRDIACSIVNRELSEAEWDRFVGSGEQQPACS